MLRSTAAIASIALFTASCSYMQSSEPLMTFDDCQLMQVRHIDYGGEEATLPTAEEALEVFLNMPHPESIPRGEYEVLDSGPGSVTWSVIDNRGNEVGRMKAEQWPSGRWVLTDVIRCVRS